MIRKLDCDYNCISTKQDVCIKAVLILKLEDVICLPMKQLFNKVKTKWMFAIIGNRSAFNYEKKHRMICCKRPQHKKQCNNQIGKKLVA